MNTRGTEIADEGMNRAEHHQDQRIVATQVRGPFRELQCLGLTARDIVGPVVDLSLRMAPADQRQRKRIIGID
jgi:hypothetical protein